MTGVPNAAASRAVSTPPTVNVPAQDWCAVTGQRPCSRWLARLVRRDGRRSARVTPSVVRLRIPFGMITRTLLTGRNGVLTVS